MKPLARYRGRLVVQLSFWAAAIATGVAAVYFAKLIGVIQAGYAQRFLEHPLLISLATPGFFLVGTAAVRLCAPKAGGSGIPQVIYATTLSHESGELEGKKADFVSIRTAVVKVVSTCLGFMGGASIGGEGPTVQIAASIFGSIRQRLRRFFPDLDLHSYLVASAGAGIAAAFNTPLGGIAFALEEFALGGFGPLRHLILLAVIIAGLVTQAIAGDELYFGRPDIHAGGLGLIRWAILIGIGGGILGGVFGRLVAWKGWTRLRIFWWVRALGFGVAVGAITYFSGGQTAGSGYALTRDFMTGRDASLPLLFPVAKMVSTAFSTLSGLGGGILAPSLSIGAWTGVSIGKIAAFSDLRVCALLGMTAYFTGAFQIPITAIIVCMEITNQHDVIFPMMISALCAFGIARLIMPTPLYHVLVERFKN